MESQSQVVRRHNERLEDEKESENLGGCEVVTIVWAGNSTNPFGKPA